MKKIMNINISSIVRLISIMLIALIAFPAIAQEADTTDEEPTKKKERPARRAFESAWWFDGQTGTVYDKGTLEMIINHRFGTIKNGNYDMFGIYGPSNIRMGFAYAPINRLNVGFGYTKGKKILDLYAKYMILQQTRSNSMPISLTYHGIWGMGMQSGSTYQQERPDNAYKVTDRFTYFNQLILMRRFGNKFSAQIAPSYSHHNVVYGEWDIEGTDTVGVNYMENGTFAISVGMRYKVNATTVIMAGYDQPLTQHSINPPKPNISLGVELNTSSHAFQIFIQNYNAIVPQENFQFNQNDFTKTSDGGVWLIGFNMTRLWSL
jgi:hypothetical protein